MVSEKEILIGNSTTILMFVFSAFGGGAIIDWLGGTSQASIIIGACLGVGYAIVNAYFPNYFDWLNNNVPKTQNCECSGLEDSFEKELEEISEEEISEDEGTC